MSESIPSPESKSEQFPSIDTVLKGFDTFLKGAEIKKVIRKIEDEQGLQELWMESTLPNGDPIDCSYTRATTLTGTDFPSRIRTVVYDSSGEGASAGPQLDYINGEWVEIK